MVVLQHKQNKQTNKKYQTPILHYLIAFEMNSCPYVTWNVWLQSYRNPNDHICLIWNEKNSQIGSLTSWNSKSQAVYKH